MNNYSTNQKQLMEYINQVSFAMDDTRLFLDTHPKNASALRYFNEMAVYRRKAVDEYESKYGPICQYDEEIEWEWNEAIFPWQMGGVACRTPR